MSRLKPDDKRAILVKKKAELREIEQHALARMARTHWPGSSGNRYLVASLDTGNLLEAQAAHKPNGFSERDDPLRKAIEHPPHKTHRPLS